MTKEEAKELFQNKFYKVDESRESVEYDELKAIPTKTGWLMIHQTCKYWNDKLRKKVLFSKGKIYENGTLIGEY